MELSETAKLLAKAALLDNRTVDEMTVGAWHETVGHLDFRDALRALTLHRQESDAWLMPAHIVRLAPRARREREVVEARERAVRALPPSPPQPMPKAFREFLDGLGKGPFSTAKTTTGKVVGPGSDSGPSVTPSRAAEGAS